MNLPTEYFSHSQMEKWQYSKTEYVRRYFHRIEEPPTPALLFGRWFAETMEALHQGLLPPVPSEATNRVLSELTILDKAEVRLTAEIHPGLSVQGYLDTATEDLREVIDYKTGAHPWTQQRTESAGQLKMYAMLVYENTGYLPDSVGIEWAETKSIGSLVEFTGRVEKFYYAPTLRDIEDYRTQVIEVARQVSAAWQAYLGELDGFSSDPFEQYYYARAFLNHAKALEDEAKQRCIDLMVATGVRHYESRHGKFYASTRKTYTYPEAVSRLEETVKEAKKAAIEAGTAEVNEQMVYSFRENKKDDNERQ